MTAFTEHEIRNLAGCRSATSPVVSLFLDVDGRRRPRPRDYELRLEDLIRRARSRVAGMDRATQAGVEADLQRIRDLVRGGIDRSQTRGLAVFACSSTSLWQVLPLPMAVGDRVVLNHTPYVRPLEEMLEEYERFAVLLVDRQRARLLLFELGRLVDKQEELDQLPRHDDDGGVLSKDQVAGHTAQAVSRHLRRAAQVAFAFLDRHGFDHLILGTADELAGELERQLHPYLRARIAARVSVPVGASDDEIRQAALAVEEGVERRKEEAIVERLRQAAAAGTGVVGLEGVLQSIVARRAHTLVLSDGFEAPGWRCPSCRYVGLMGRTCPLCGQAMHETDDVVEEAVEDALAQSCRVEVCRGNADLDVMGRVGALLRF